jgi:GNAT superfamily N-acetyltransferase
MTQTDEIAIPDAWRDAAGRKDIPLEMVRRALELRVPRATIERFLTGPWGDAKYFERRIYWHERLTFGSLRGRDATTADAEAFSELWANSPEEIDDWEVITERSPNPFAQFRLQEDVSILVIEDQGVLVATCAFAPHKAIVGGKRITVHYGQALRVHKDYRRQGFGDQVRSLSWSANAARPTATQYDYMRSRNFAVVGWWEKYVPGFFDNIPDREGDVPGISVTVLQYPARPFDGSAAGIRKVHPDDAKRCVALINRTHRGHDLFRPYSEHRLEERLDDGFWGELDERHWWPHVYGWEDYYVLEEAGRIVACAGLWDRGRDIRDRWRHRETGETKVIELTAVLDFGYATGHHESMARLLRYLIGETHHLGRDYLTVPLDRLPKVVDALSDLDPVPETRALRWDLDEPKITKPYTDLAYW